jgi:hypothetical protein
VRDGGTPVTPLPDDACAEPARQMAADGVVLEGGNGRVGGWRLLGRLEPDVVGPQPNLNVLHRRTFVPVLHGRLDAGSHVLATAWYAAADGAPPGAPPLLRIIAADRYEAVWPDGGSDQVSLPDLAGEPLAIVTGGGFPWPPEPAR